MAQKILIFSEGCCQSVQQGSFCGEIQSVHFLHDPVGNDQAYAGYFPGSSDGTETACNAGDLGLIPGSGRSPVDGNDNPFQYFCL